MADTDSIRTAVGILGNIISACLFLSPIPTFVSICKAKSVQAFKPDPYVATVLNCMMWVFYGLPVVHPDSLLVVTINGTGLLIELAYVSIFVIYSNARMRKKIFIALLIEVIFIAAVVIVTLGFFHTSKARSMIVGILCIIFNIIMYTSPLTVMKTVIQTKSVKYMPLLLSLANFANGLVWMTYALLKLDPYILFPNGLGALSGVVQLILYATYYKTTNWDEDEKPSDVELAEKTDQIN